MQLFVQYKQTVISSVIPDEPYGPWSTELDFKPTKVTIDRPTGYEYEAFELDFDVNRGDKVYVLTIIYSSGDSFGSSTGNGEILWVFKDATKAKEVAKLYDNSESYTIDILTEKGTKIQLSNPAYGYFENVSSMEVDEFIVE